MALNYPGFVVPQPSSSKLSDILAMFDDGLTSGRAEKAEREAPDAFASYIDSLGLNTGRPAAAVVPTFGATPSSSDRLVNDSAAAGEMAAASVPGDLTAYLSNIRAAESGGNDAAKNPNSTATGRYQFTAPTWRGLMQSHPELGLTPDGMTDPTQQERAIRVFTGENASQLAKAGVAVNPGSLYAAHFLGAGGATKALGYAPETPMLVAAGPEVVKANPFLADMTVGDFTQWAAQKGGGSGTGYQPPMGDVPSPGATVPEGTASGPLPPREVMLRLFANPITRPLAIELAKSAQENRAPKPIEVNGQLVDPRSGKVLGDYRTPTAPKAPDVETRYNPQTGLEEKVIRNLTTGEWEPFGGQKAPSNGMQITTNPDGTMTLTQGGSGMPKLTEAQSKDTVYVTRASGALPTLDRLEDKLLSLGENVAGNVPYGQFLQSDEYQQADNAGREFLAAILRKDTGAAVTPSELSTYGQTYLPQPGDKPGVIAQKKAARARAVKAISLGLPPAAILELESQGVVIPSLPGAAPAAGGALPEGVTEEDIEYTMKQHGLTRAQVLEQLNAP